MNSVQGLYEYEHKLYHDILVACTSYDQCSDAFPFCDRRDGKCKGKIYQFTLICQFITLSNYNLIMIIKYFYDRMQRQLRVSG